jgi:hypothetical protein
MSLEDTLSSWAQAPSQSEQQRCENAEQAIRKAIAQSAALQTRDVTVFTHGSYRNRVNVRQDSDIDIGVRCRDTFYFNLPAGYSREQFGIAPATYSFPEFKIELEQALVSYFGRSSVTRGDKAFDLKDNSYRVEADVAPFFEYRSYSQTGSYEEGVKLVTDSGREIINYPEQHYDLGVQKNNATSRSFKGIVRILKRVAVETDARLTPGFLIECMSYNAPNHLFGYPTWSQASREVLAFLFNNTLNEQACGQWVEVSGLKWLFHPTQKWDWRIAHQFTDHAWEGFGFT